MSGCEGCLTTNKGQNEELQKAKQEAKQYAINNDVSMAVYKEGYEYKYIRADEAIAGGFLIVAFVSKYN
jgi:hypothetical protein